MKSALPPSRFVRFLKIAAVLLALFTIVGFLIAPPILKSQLQKRLSAELGRQVTMGKVRLNPYALSVTIEDFDIRLKEGNGSFIGWTRLYVNFDALSSLGGDWVLDNIELQGFHGATVILPDGTLNFADIVAKLNATPEKPAPEPKKPGRPLRISRLKIDQARFEFIDESRPQRFKTVVGPFTFAVTGFRTSGSLGAVSSFDAVTEAGEKVGWAGTLSVDPIKSAGEFHVDNIVLAKYAPYYAEKISADLTEGKLSLSGRYELNFGEGQRGFKLHDGAVQLRNLKVVERATQTPAVELPSFDVTGIGADLVGNTVTVGSVAFGGGHLRVRRSATGEINLATLLLPPAAGPAAATTPPPAPPATGNPPGGTAPVAASPAPKLPDWRIGAVTLKDFQIEVADEGAPRPAQLALSGLQFSLQNVTLADGAQMPLELTFNWAPQGTVRVAGTVGLKPTLTAELRTDVGALEILPLSPYVEQFVNARITQGTLSLGLKTQLSQPAAGPVAATVAGEISLDKFGTVDGVQNAELAGLGQLALRGLSLHTAPEIALKIDEVVLAAPYARVVVNSDKTLNLAAVARTTPASTPAAAPAVPAAPTVTLDPPATTAPAANVATPGPKIEIGRVVISDGDFSFADRSVEPNVRTAIKQFSGTVTGLSSVNLAKAGVDLKAAVDGVGPVAITGQLDPLGAAKFVDLKIDFKNVDLLPLSPYTAKYAGYELARGKLMLDVKFLLDGKKIDASNVVTLNQFTFGAPVKSPDATGLPVRLGVALLKDTEGKIVIDVPIQGSTDDPNFKIGRVVLRVVVNLLTKAATSPFSLLGSMFGGGGDELAYQEFAPGAADLQPTEIKKLETMVTALTNRPALSVALEGSYDGPADTFALKQQKSADTVRRAVWEQKHALNPNIAPPDQLVITPEEQAVMIQQLFAAKFPAGTQFGAPLAKAPEAAAPPPPAKKGIFGRVVDAVTLKGLRNRDRKSADEPVATPTPAAGVETASGISLEEMTGRLAETMVVDENDLRGLATRRAERVRDYFTGVGKIDPERLFLAKDATAQAAKGPRVFLSLQ